MNIQPNLSAKNVDVAVPSLAQLFSGSLGKRVRALADWRRKGQLGKAAQHKRRRAFTRFEMLEPRVLLSADSVLGAGATTAIVDTFVDYANLVQTHIDTDDSYATLVPGLTLLQRDTDHNGVIDDKDQALPHMRDLLAAEVEQVIPLETPNPVSPSSSSSPNAIYDALTGGVPGGTLVPQEYYLGVLDTNNDSVVSWKEAFTGIVVGAVHDLLLSFDPDGDGDFNVDGSGDGVTDGADVAFWLRNGGLIGFTNFEGLTDQFQLGGSIFPQSGFLGSWLSVGLSNLNISGGGTNLTVAFDTAITFTDNYRIDLGFYADQDEIAMAQWEFNYGAPGGTPTVTSLDSTANRDVLIAGKVIAPVSVSSSGASADFSAAGDIHSSVKADGDGSANLFGKIVNVGFLGTVAISGSSFDLSMDINTKLTDPSSPEHLGFLDGDGNNTALEKVTFEAVSSGGVLTGGDVGSDAFNLATPIKFDLTLSYVTGSSGAVPFSVDLSAADDVTEVKTALENAINASSLNGLVTVTLAGSALTLHLTGSDATPLGFTDGTHSDASAPFILTATNGFDFDTNDDTVEDGADTPVTFGPAAFLLSLNGALPKMVTVAGGSYTSSGWRSAVQTALDAQFGGGAITASVNVSDLNDVKLSLTSASKLEIADTDTLSLKMSAANVITKTELAQLAAASPDQTSRLFNSTPDKATDKFSIVMNLGVRDGLDYTPSGTPQFRVDSTFGTADGPFDLSSADIKKDSSGFDRFALERANNADFAQYLDFNVFGRSETLAMVQQLEGWAERLEQSVALGGYDIPLLQSTLGKVINFSDMVHDLLFSDDVDDSTAGNDIAKLLNKVTALDKDNPSIIFFTAQEFGAALHDIGVLATLPSGDFATYDKVNRDLLYKINATNSIADVTLPVDFNLPLPPLGNIYSKSSLFLTAQGSFDAILGIRMGDAGSIDDDTLLTSLNNGGSVDIYDDVAITGATPVEQVFGRLLADATFDVTIAGVTYTVIVSAASTGTNLYINDPAHPAESLVKDIKDALAGAVIKGTSTPADLSSQLDVTQSGDRIALVAKPGVSQFSLNVNTSDTAFTQLGLQTGAASTVSWTSKSIANVASGNGGTLTIDIFGATGPADLLIDNATGNASVSDLVNDINERISGSTLAGKIIATRQGDRIVLSAIDSTVYGFSVDADSTADNFFSDDFTDSALEAAWLTLTSANAPDDSTLARYGRVSTPFALTINGTVINISVAETATFGSMQEFADLLNSKIPGTDIVAEVNKDGTRIVLRANSDAVTGLNVTAPSSGALEMGFTGTEVAGKLGVTGNRAAPSYFGPTDTVSFQVIVDGGAPKTVTLDLANPATRLDVLSNATVYDLAADVQRALNAAFGSASLNPLQVDVDGGRLLFTIKPGSAGLGAMDFQIKADTANPSQNRAIAELGLSNPDAPPAGVVTLDANEWDLLIKDSNGKVFGVTLDGETTVGGVLNKINLAAAAAGSDVVAGYNSLQNGLRLSEASVGTGQLTVRTVNGSDAAIDLGIYLGGTNQADATGSGTPGLVVTRGEIIGDTIGTLALMDRMFLRQIDGNTPIVSATLSITSDNPDTVDTEQIELEANFGFVAVKATGGGTLTGSVGISLQPDDDNRVTLRELFSAVSADLNGDTVIDIDDFTQVVELPEFDLTGTFNLDVEVVPGGGVEGVINNATVGSLNIVVTDPGNPFLLQAPDVDVTWTAGDLGDLTQFSNIDFEDVLNGLKSLADFLDDYAAFGFLNEDIPLIGVNFNELVDLADRFRAAVVEIEQNPAGSVQLLEQKIREEFGLPAGILTLSMDDGIDGDSAPGDMLKITFNLGAAFSESLAVQIGIPNDAIDGAPIDISLQGHADLNAKGNLDAKFTIGVDLNSPLDADAAVVLYTNFDDTHILGTLSASANDLSFNAALGPVGVTIADGSASINISAGLSSSDGVGSKWALGSAFSRFTQITFNGSANATLPVYFPTQSNYIGDISLVAAFEADGTNLDITNFDVNVPTDFNLDFSAFSIFDNLGLLIDATDFFLSGVQDALDGQILGFELPLVGDNLAEAAHFIEDFRAGFIHDLRNLVENAPGLAAETVQGFLWDLLGASGINLLADTNGDGSININDVIIEGLDTLDDADVSNDYLQWNILLGQTFSPDVNIDFDLGFPALGLKSDVELNVTLGWELGIGLGISIADGAYIDVLRQDYTTPSPSDVLPELRLVFDVELADTSSLTGSLLFLQLDINEAPRDINGDSIDDPTHFHAEFSVDLTNGGDASKERLSFSELGNLDFDLDLSADAAVNLDLVLKFNEDLIGDSPISAILPQIDAHFALYWEVNNVLSGDVNLGDGLEYMAFEDVSLDLGKFLGDLIVPLVEKIQSVTEPFQPIIDIVTARIPVLSDLAGETITLLDIAAAFGEFNPDLIYALADLVSLVNSIPTDVDSLIINFGDFVIYEEGGTGFGGISASDLADPNFSFAQQGADDPFKSAFDALESSLPGINDLISAANGTSNPTGSAVSGLLGGNFNKTGGDGTKYGFAFPLFEDPQQIFGLLVGRQAAIVTYDLPPFVMDFSWKQSFPIYGPLWGVVTAGVGMKIDLAFGYDTQGVADFFNSGFSNPLTLLGGLYVSDTDHPDGSGTDVPELVFTGTIGVGAELNAGIASAGVTANIILTVNFDLYDPNHDGKIRIDELVDTFLYEIRSGDPALAPLALFDINGEISFQLKAFIEFLFAKFEFEITPPITLFEFSIPFEREPFLATERDDGSLLLNIGTNAAARMNGDLRDLGEEICVEYVDSTHVKVWSKQFGVEEGGAQVYSINPDVGIFAYGGEGNDKIVVHGPVKVTAEGGTGDDIIIVDGNKSANLHGNLGNDTLVGGSAADIIYGDEGDDVIDGREGNDWLFGDFGQISYGPTGSIRVTAGPKDGSDVIWGGLGDDIVFGGGNDDLIAGDTGAITGITVSSITLCGVTINFGAGLASAGNADFLFGDGGRIDALGTSTDTVLNLNLTRTTVDGRSVFAGITLTDRDGGGNDLILGQGGTDAIFAGSGDDQVDGGDGNDTIFGETGLDTLSGGANDDEISGGLGKDWIFGFGAGPGDPYNDGGNTSPDGNDLLFGDDGNDLIRGNGGNDTLFGGRGADVLFGDAGTDRIFGENEADVIFGGAGNDYVEGGTGNDTVFGDDGVVMYFAGVEDDRTDDRVIGDAFAFGGTNALFDYYDDGLGTATGDDDNDLTLDLMITYVRAGSDGDDTVIGGEGDDIAFGGAGNDTLFGDIDPTKWLADYASVTPPPVPSGSDALIGDGGRIEWWSRRIDKIESFKGATGADAGDDTISGNGGPDRLFGGGGSDTMYGRMPASFADGVNAGKLDEDVGVEAGKEASDDDIMLGDDGLIDFARGTTKLVRIASTIYSPLAGETYNDHMFGNWGRDIELGGLGADEIYGDTGLTFSEPRGADDIILGDNGELLYADNTITANFGRLEMVRTTDISDSTGGADTINGAEGDDVIFGGVNDGGIDSLIGGLGSDVMLGDNGELDFALGADTNLDTLDLIRSYRDGLGGRDNVSGDAGNDVQIGGTAGDEMFGDNATASSGANDGEDIMLGDNADIFLLGTAGRLKVRVADMSTGTAVDLITTTDTSDAFGGADTMSGNAKADIILGGVNAGGTDILYGDRAAPTSTTITDDGNDIELGDNGLLDFTFGADADRNTLDLIRSFEDGLGGADNISGNKGLDVAIGGTGADVIYGDDATASAAAADLGDLLLGDNADIFLVAPGAASGGDLKLVLSAAVKTIRTTDEEHPEYGGADTISGNAGGDIIAGGVKGDTLYGDRSVPTLTTTGDDGNDLILGDNGAFEWLSTGRLGEITGIDIAANNIDLYNKFNPGVADTDLTTLDLVTTEQATSGGRDLIYGDQGKDVVFGGTDADTIYGDDGNDTGDATNNDVLFGDHGRIYLQYPRFQLLNSTTLVSANFPSRNYFAIDVGNTSGGEGDRMWGEEGNDVMLGQQGDDRMWGGSGDDDMIGGHNVAGGYDELTAPAIVATINPAVNDLMDGGSGDDAMAGDNAIIWRRGDDISPRFRALTAASLYTTTADTITANIGALNQSDPDDAVGRDIQLLDHSDAVEANSLGRFGNDVMAGGADSDVMFGQLGNDLMQGDGSIETAAAASPFLSDDIVITDSGNNPDTDQTLWFNIREAATDADDYMEGNGGNDLMYGGLGQDDMIGGSSALFGLNAANAALLGYTEEQMRPDGSDTMFGGAGIDILRNDIGDTTFALAVEDPVTHVITTQPGGHARDADFIMGDNANVFRAVTGGASGTNPSDVNDTFRTFNYDALYGGRIIPRVMQQLDYTLGGADYEKADHPQAIYVSGAADLDGAGPLAPDNGAADLIHGESGDDIIFGMTGSDIMFGEGQDDDIVGGYGNDWISGGTGQDGVIGDDGIIRTSRNSTIGEALNGVAGLRPNSADNPKYNEGDVLDELIATPGEIQIATINISGELKKTADITPFSYDPAWLALDDEFPDNMDNIPFADDIIFGGLGSDFLHGGSGDDAISGAEALPHAFVPASYNAQGQPTSVLDLGYSAVGLPGTQNPGDVLAFNAVDVDGQHLNNRFRAGEFALYDEFDPRREIFLTPSGGLYKVDGTPGVLGVDYFEFLLNFNEGEGVLRPGGTVPKATGQQTETYPDVNDDGRDMIFGDLGNDWLVGGTGRDDLFGGWGNDYLNADDNLSTETTGVAAYHDNESPDTHPYYEDRAYGGAGRDILIGNTGGDRLIDWVGEYNSFLVPYAPFGQASVSRTLMPHLHEFLYALSAGDGADSTRYADAIGGTPPAPTNNDPIPSRFGEPHGELGLVLQKDFAWQDQTGAPADPQAGNIPGGKRDVLRSASFNDGTLSGFAVDSGSFTVSGGALQVAAASLGKDATGIFTLDEQLPSYYEFLASLKVDKPTAGWKANSYLVFDYFDKVNFKYAGVNISTNKLEIGYHDATGWHVVKDAPSQLKAGTFYNMMLAVNGTTVTLTVDNKAIMSYTFAPHVDSDGSTYGLNRGLLGLGSDNSRGSFDNVVVQRVPPGYTLQQTELFGGPGAGTLFDGATLGSWQVVNGRYEDTTANGLAYSLIDLGLGRGLETGSILELSAKFNLTGTGGFIFDRYADNDYKFVTLDAAANKVYIGHVSPQGGMKIDASFSKVIDPGIEYTLTLSLKGTSVNVSLAVGTGTSSLVGGFVFNGVTLDGDFGVLSTVGKTSFDSVTVKTSDSAFAAPSGATMLAAMESSDSAGTFDALTQDQLNAILEAAIAQWTALLGAADPRLALLTGVRISTEDMVGLALGRTDGTDIVVDVDAAGYGWFVDVTPSDNAEYRIRTGANMLGATPSSDAFGHMDLLTVVTHEVGHVLGLDHQSSLAIMDADLEAGARYLLGEGPAQSNADAHASDTAKAQVADTKAAGKVPFAFDDLFLPAAPVQNGVIDWGDGSNGVKKPAAIYSPPKASANANFTDFLVKFSSKGASASRSI